MFNDILIFMKIVETGSFTNASIKLGITQATVSRRIQELESELNIELIKRNTRQIEITPIGMSLYDKLKDTELYVRNVIAELKANVGGVTGTLKVSLANAMSYTVISPHIPRFLRDNPGVTLELYYDSRPIDLFKSPYDMAIASELPKQQTVLSKKIATLYLKLYCTPSYKEKYGIPETAEELDKHMLTGALYNDYSTSKTVTLKNSYTQENVPVNWGSRVYLNSVLHAITMAKSGEIICGSWDKLVKEELQSGVLIPVLPEYILEEISFYQIRRPNAKSALIDLFSNFVADCLKLDAINE